LKVVVRETGLKPDTLRVWEKRYGIPNPERTSGGHRLYSQRDIDILKWLMARQKEGMRISQAVNLWQQLEAEGKDPLESPASAAAPIASQTQTDLSLEGGDALTKLRQAWVAACLTFDRTQADQVLNQAFALYAVETVCLKVLVEGLVQVGQGWYEGEISVQQEHFASALAVRRINALIAASPAPTRGGRILIACPPEEEHTVSLLLVNLFLRRQGWDVIYLGANVPIDRLQTTITTVKPDLVISAAQLLTTAASLLEMSQVIQKAQVPFAFGGAIFNRSPDLRKHIPGHFMSEKLEEVPQQVERWLTSVVSLSVNVKTKPTDPAYPPALANFARHQRQIETDLAAMVKHTPINPDEVAAANRRLSDHITAALKLGKLESVNIELDWVKGLMSFHNVPPDQLNIYINAYCQAARRHLDPEGEPIIAWLERLANKGEAA
jgi:methanogenic corrinoid protein MtbC1